MRASIGTQPTLTAKRTFSTIFAIIEGQKEQEKEGKNP
jgi:hypothetical protein